MRAVLRLVVVALCAALGMALCGAMLDLPEQAVTLPAEVGKHLGASGVSHRVTAVLLNFRGYDTLLEIAVLLLALFGVLAVGVIEPLRGKRKPGALEPMLGSLASMLAPLVVLAAAYLLWAGSHQAGGAFQAGAVLAAGAVLLFLAGLLAPWPDPGAGLRFALAAGLLLFLLVAALTLGHARLLDYPARAAAALIVAIETGLSITLALILSGLFLWLPDEYEEAEP